MYCCAACNVLGFEVTSCEVNFLTSSRLRPRDLVKSCSDQIHVYICRTDGIPRDCVEQTVVILKRSKRRSIRADTTMHKEEIKHRISLYLARSKAALICGVQ